MRGNAHDEYRSEPLIVVPEMGSRGLPERDGVAVCRRCGRVLKTPVSVEAGIGPVCGRKESEQTQTPHRSGASAQIPTKDLSPV